MSSFRERLQEMLKSEEVGSVQITDLFNPLPPIKRELWTQLQIEVRNLLEECGYKHFNPEIDSIEVDHAFFH